MNTPRILLAGTGNLGAHLLRRLADIGYPVSEILTRRPEALPAAWRGNAFATASPEALHPQPDLCILAVRDSVIADTAAALKAHLHADTAVVHTSGATPAAVLAPYFSRHGVLYPLQTFSREVPPDWSAIPVCVHGSDAPLHELLLTLGKALGKAVYALDDTHRAALHVAAVFANNFSNHLYHIAERICAKEDIPFDLLKPLIEETALKIKYLRPEEAQTGPAVRGDQGTLNRHLSYLQLAHPEFAALYAQLTASIQNSRRAKP